MGDETPHCRWNPSGAILDVCYRGRDSKRPDRRARGAACDPRTGTGSPHRGLRRLHRRRGPGAPGPGGAAVSGTPGVWSLPGGAVAHGEHPLTPSCARPPPRPACRSRSAGLRRRARRHAGAAEPRRHHPHRPADLRGHRARRRAARPHRPADRPGPLARRWPRPVRCRCARSPPLALGLPRGRGRPAPRRAAGVPVVPRRARPGRPAPRAALRRLRRRHRPGRAGAADPGRAGLPGRRPLAPARRRHRLRRAARRSRCSANWSRRPASGASWSGCSGWRATATPRPWARRATRSTGTASARSTGSRCASRRRWPSSTRAVPPTTPAGTPWTSAPT